MIVNQIFLAVALIRLAELDAGCADLAIGEVCKNRVYGMLPSSLLTAITAVTGILASLVLPPIGYLVDKSGYRRGVGVVTSIVVLGCAASNLILSVDTWFLVMMISIVSTVFYFVHLMIMYSYLPELDEDDAKLTAYNGTFLAIRSIVMIPVLPAVLGLGILYKGDVAFVEDDTGNTAGTTIEFDVALAKISQILTLTLAAMGFFNTFWNGLKPREPMKKSKGDKSSPLATARMIYRDYPSLFWFCLAVIPFSNTIMSFAGIALTFMTTFLKMGAVQVLLVIAIFTTCGVVGSKVHPFIARRINLLNDIKLNMCLWMVASLVTGVLVNSPSRKMIFIVLSSFWGFIFGWAVPSMRSLYITIIPEGQNAEFMGIYVLISSGVIWLPPLLFTILNEVGVQMNEIMALSTNVFALALFFVLMMDPYDKAVADAKQNGGGDEENGRKLLTTQVVDVVERVSTTSEDGIIEGDVQL